jgi:hypothetical protein
MNKHKSILTLYTNVAYIRGDVAYDENDNIVNYDEAAVEAHAQSQVYKQQRAAEYPSIVDQLDKIFHDGIDEWKETIQAVKDKYPKS